MRHLAPLVNVSIHLQFSHYQNLSANLQKDKKHKIVDNKWTWTPDGDYMSDCGTVSYERVDRLKFYSVNNNSHLKA